MAFDAHATQQLINNPADFLANNYVKVVGRQVVAAAPERCAPGASSSPDPTQQGGEKA